MTIVIACRCTKGVVARLQPHDRPITVRPDFSQPKVRVGFPSRFTNDDATEYTRTVLASTPGCSRVTHYEGGNSFWVRLNSRAAEAKVAAQCFIEQAFLVPHLFACSWYTAGPPWEQGMGTIQHLWGFHFLEPVANSLASTIMARLTESFVPFETLHLDSHTLVLRFEVSRPATYRYSDILEGTPIQAYGIIRVDPWNQEWEWERFLGNIRSD